MYLRNVGKGIHNKLEILHGQLTFKTLFYHLHCPDRVLNTHKAFRDLMKPLKGAKETSQYPSDFFPLSLCLALKWGCYTACDSYSGMLKQDMGPL